MNKTVNYMGRNQLRNQLLRNQSNRRRLWMIGIGIIIASFFQQVSLLRQLRREKYS